MVGAGDIPVGAGSNPASGIQIVLMEDSMKPSTKDEVGGKVHEVKGKIKEQIGRATNNSERKK